MRPGGALQARANCSADSSGSTDASGDIQSCLNGGGTVSLASGGVYKIASTLHMYSNTTLTADGGSHAELVAAAGLSGPLIEGTSLSSVTITKMTFTGLKALGYYKGNLGLSNCNTSGFNANFAGSFTVDDVESREAACGTGLGVAGTFTVVGSYIHDNGWSPYSDGVNSVSDGMTVDHCDSCEIAYNDVNDNTDVDIVVGGGSNGSVHNNSIYNSGEHAWAGIHVGWFPGGGGDHTGMTYYSNTVSAAEDMMSFGIIVGFNPWWNPDFSWSAWVSNAGEVTGNTISGAAVNLAVNGIGDGYIHGNSMSDPYNSGSSGFPNACDVEENYTAHMFYGATLDSGWAPAWFFREHCGYWNTSLPWIDRQGALFDSELLNPNDVPRLGTVEPTTSSTRAMATWCSTTRVGRRYGRSQVASGMPR